jgi:high-affinity iron transporter
MQRLCVRSVLIAALVAAAAADAGAALDATGDAPLQMPARERGGVLYGEACAACHGASGRGDGRRAPELEPPPRSFHDPDAMDAMSPARAYAAITRGISDTAMAAFDLLPVSERWSLAFFAVALRHAGGDAERGEAIVRARPGAVAPSLAHLAQRTDAELDAELAAAGLGDSERADSLAFLRHHPLRHVRRAQIAGVRARLGDALGDARAGDLDSARRAAAAAHGRDLEAIAASLPAAARRDLEADIVALRRALAAPDASIPRVELRAGALAAALDAQAEIPSGIDVGIAAAGRAAAAMIPLAILALLAAAGATWRRSRHRPSAGDLTCALGLGAVAAAAAWRALIVAPSFALAAARADAAIVAIASASLAAVAIAAASVALRRAPRSIRLIAVAIAAASCAGHVARGVQLAMAAAWTPAPIPQLTALGVFPVWEILAAQAMILALALGVSFAPRSGKRRLRRPAPSGTARKARGDASRP